MPANAGMYEVCFGLELCDNIFPCFFLAESGLYGKADTTISALRKSVYPSGEESLKSLMIWDIIGTG